MIFDSNKFNQLSLGCFLNVFHSVFNMLNLLGLIFTCDCPATETKGATSSGIFPVENGPIEMLVGDRKNIRAGLYTSRLKFLAAAITNIIGIQWSAKSAGPLMPGVHGDFVAMNRGADRRLQQVRLWPILALDNGTNIDTI